MYACIELLTLVNLTNYVSLVVLYESSNGFDLLKMESWKAMPIALIRLKSNKSDI